MSRARELLWTSVVGCADVVVLTQLRPDWSGLATGLGHPHAWTDRVGSEQAAATLVSALLWCLAIWLAAGLVFALLSATPGRPGRVARLLAERLLPAALLRVMVGAAGLSVLLAPVSATAAATTSSPGLSHVTAPAPSWPTSAPSATPTNNSTNNPTNSPTVPITTGPTSTSAPSQTAPPPTAPPVPTSTTTTPPTPTTTGATPPGSGTVVVGAGDSLWTITARHLGASATPAQIAARWPSWYQANREVIGADPGLLHPGEVLIDPGRS